MIRRTLLEWQSLPHGVGENRIPAWAADRLVAVARRSPLGGEGGGRILTDGRNALRACQVVGVVAGENCSLEILPKIDIPGCSNEATERGLIRKKLVHLLAVAMDMEIDGGAITDLGWQRDSLLEILLA